MAMSANSCSHDFKHSSRDFFSAYRSSLTVLRHQNDYLLLRRIIRINRASIGIAHRISEVLHGANDVIAEPLPECGSYWRRASSLDAAAQSVDIIFLHAQEQDRDGD